jgi:CheY-like chemotaxis protein
MRSGERSLEPDTRPTSVLIVDDSDEVREVLSFLLEHSGYLADTAAGADEALTKLRANPPSVIVLDLMMPDVDGFDFRRAQLADEAIRDIPVVLYSAAFDLRAMALRMKAAGFAAKTGEVGALLSAIAQAAAGPAR